jgi:hypothetical protein
MASSSASVIATIDWHVAADSAADVALFAADVALSDALDADSAALVSDVDAFVSDIAALLAAPFATDADVCALLA